MFNRLSSIVSGSGDLFRAEGELLLARFRSAFLWTSLAFAAVSIASVAFVALFVCGVIILAEEIGWVGAVASAATLLLVVSVTLAAWFWKRAASNPHAEAEPPAEVRAEIAKNKLKGPTKVPVQQEHAPKEHPTESNDQEQSGSSWEHRVSAFVKENPGLVASGAFAAFALVGPSKLLRLAGRGMMVASIVQRMNRMKTDQDSSQAEQSNAAHNDTPSANHVPVEPKPFKPANRNDAE